MRGGGVAPATTPSLPPSGGGSCRGAAAAHAPPPPRVAQGYSAGGGGGGGGAQRRGAADLEAGAVLSRYSEEYEASVNPFAGRGEGGAAGPWERGSHGSLFASLPQQCCTCPSSLCAPNPPKKDFKAREREARRRSLPLQARFLACGGLRGQWACWC